MLVLHGRGSLRRLVAGVLIALILAVGLPAFGFVPGEGPLISCSVCYDIYPDWWCHYVWGCPWPGGGEAGARLAER